MNRSAPLARLPLDALLLHAGTELEQVWGLMHFSTPLERMSHTLKSTLPTTQRLRDLDRRLRRSSCAVVGASASLKHCSDARRICDHSVVIHVNDHQDILKVCPRTDVQVVNQFACYWSETPTKGFFTQPQTGARRPCRVTPSIARIRHEWSPASLDKFSRGSLLSTGVINRIARSRVGKCCASAGGVATSLALEVCSSVTVFGMAGVNQTHFDSNSHMPKLHDLSRERDWMVREERSGRLRRLC
jgi:hypothetical protein